MTVDQIQQAIDKVNGFIISGTWLKESIDIGGTAVKIRSYQDATRALNHLKGMLAEAQGQVEAPCFYLKNGGR